MFASFVFHTCIDMWFIVCGSC